MKIVIIGGSGLIGTKLVEKLGALGHEPIAASPKSGVDTLTGDGVATVLAGASVVIDVSNSPSFEDAKVMEFFTKSTRNLLTYEAAAKVTHHVALSIVGSERMTDSGYMRAKLAQEALIKSAAIPFSIVHSTQFFEFGKSIADGATDGAKVRIAPVAFQPIAADDVAAAVAKVAVSPPLMGTVEIAGPETFRFDAFIRRGIEARNETREVVADAHARYFGTELAERSLVPGDGARLGAIRFEDWLTQSARPPLKDNEFRVSEVPPGKTCLVAGVVAVYNVGGRFCATQNECTHQRGSLNEGTLDGSRVTCPWHGSVFDVGTGAVLQGPATKPLQTYRVTVEGDIGRVEPD